MIVAAAFIGGLVLLYIGGEALVRGASAIGVKLGMSPMVVGLTIVAFATSAPELAVAIGAALRDAPGLAVGNVVGSNICNLTLIVGIVVLLSRPSLRDKLIQFELLVLITATILVTILLIDAAVTRLEGVVLLAGIVTYIGVAVWRLQSDNKTSLEDLESSVPILSGSISTQALFCAAGVGALILGSDWLVDACVAIATALGIAPAVVGLTAAAFGTSLPEIAASIVAARHRHPDLAAGNLIGSNIFNLLVVLGGTSLVRPLVTGFVTGYDIAIMCAATFVSLGLMYFRARLNRLDGAFLVAIYFAYIAFAFSPSTAP
ncbi:MAG TPA: calcium/sodium antiporter [Gammaproteobacteria bacterium]|nr:calcium/sodium antiporter [Gammaproteobacteria bacterium]